MENAVSLNLISNRSELIKEWGNNKMYNLGELFHHFLESVSV